MRQRIKGGCLYHAEGANSFMMRSEVLKNKLKRGTISEEEMWELAGYNAQRKGSMTITGEVKIDVPVKEEKFKTIRIWGKEIRLTIEEYNKHYATIKV